MTRLRCTASQPSGGRGAAMRSILRVLSTAAVLVFPAAAQADEPSAFGRIPCAAQSDGTRFCQGAVATRVPSFDGQPLDVNVSLPSTAGPAPLVLVLHGYGGSKKAVVAPEAPWLPSAHDLAQRGSALGHATHRRVGGSL